ncbi:MAG TPA: hypothetical protein PLH49_03150, partial [Chitinophagaceae bacterium]|nr:hypothetical protein [Chitinophagaceae bacterium]
EEEYHQMESGSGSELDELGKILFFQFTGDLQFQKNNDFSFCTYYKKYYANYQKYSEESL